MKKWLALALVILVLVGGYIAAGPFMTVNAIRTAVRDQDAAALSKHIDFPALRMSFKRQLDDYLVRRAGPDMQSNVFGAIALRIASGATDGLVDAMATPAGLAALLEGRNFLHRLNGSRRSEDPYTPALPRDPLEGATYASNRHRGSRQQFQNGDGEPVVFVLTRQGLRWKLTDVLLPW